MSGLVHATAVIDPGAQLGADVRVGPHAVIEGGVTIGDGCEIRAQAVICRGTKLGARNQVGYGAVIGAEPQDYAFRGFPSGVEIGAGNKIREHVTIHRSSREGGTTRIGDENFLMVGVHLGHDVRLGNQVVLVNNTLLGGHVQVEDRAFLGGATIVHQHVRIGSLVMTRGGTRLTKDLPPYFMAVDLDAVSNINRVGLRRAGYPPAVRKAIQTAYDVVYHSGLNITQALEELRRKFQLREVTQLIEFIAGSKRGICRVYRQGSYDMTEE